MNYFLLLAGLAVVAAASGDLIKTTLAMRGGGYYTTPVLRTLWGCVLRLHRRRPSHKTLSLVGPFALIAIVLLWFVPLWIGTTMIYASDPGAVLHGTSGERADLLARGYFSAYTLVTLGMGDYVPGGPVWQIATGGFATLGFFFITLTITYLIPLLNSVMKKRKVAVQISAMGLTGEQILACAEGDDTRSIESYIDQINAQIAETSQTYLAYPAIIYFHTRRRYQAFGPAIAALDRAAREHLENEGSCPEGSNAWRRSRRIISDLLFQFESPPGIDDGESPASVGEDEQKRKAENENDEPKRQAMLRRFVEYDGWDFHELAREESDPLDC